MVVLFKVLLYLPFTYCAVVFGRQPHRESFTKG